MSLTEKFNSIVTSRPAAIAGVVSSLTLTAGLACYHHPVAATLSFISAGMFANRAYRLKQQEPKGP